MDSTALPTPSEPTVSTPPTQPPPTTPPPTPGKKRSLTDKQLESLRQGREKRWRKLQLFDRKPSSETKQEESTITTPSHEDKDEDDLPLDTPQLERQRAMHSRYEELNDSSSGTDTEVVVVRRQLSKMEKKLNRQIDRRLKRMMNQRYKDVPEEKDEDDVPQDTQEKPQKPSATEPEEENDNDEDDEEMGPDREDENHRVFYQRPRSIPLTYV